MLFRSVYVAIAAVPFTWWVIYRTRFGLRLRAAGENPHALDTAGVSVAAMRYLAMTMCGVLCGIAGAYFSLGKGDAGKNLELSLQQFSAKADPSFTSQWFVSGQVGTWNWQRWANAEFDKLHEMVDSTIDPMKRAEGMIRMQKLMDESAAYVWLTYDTNLYASRSWLNPGILPNGTDWQFEYFKGV